MSNSSSSSHTLRVVIVGCGGFSRDYLSVYGSIPNLQVVACIDADLASAQAMAKALGAETASTELDAAVRASADYAVVSTPNFLHVEQATALLRSGKHVLLQKPMARWLDEARALVEFQREQSRRQMGLYMSMLDFGLWWELRQAFATEKRLGSVAQVSMRLGHTGGLAWSKQPNELWRFSREKTGGGAFIMLGVHYIHFLRWLLGLKIKRVLAQTANLHCGRIEGEDICQLQGDLDNGGFVQLSVAWNSHGEHFAIYGTEGSLVYLDNELLRVHSAKPWKTSYFDYERAGQWQSFPGVVPPKLDDPANPHNQHRAFAEAIRTGQKPAVDAIEGLWDMQVTGAVYRSAASGRWEIIHYV
ncbi:MAG: Gfo/Idh/MocA family oxidoreductase [Opitutaceae bacterium]|nr:Gfo/Idh/MocA family oxidoreductase [Opitutaceae bacterium]